VAAAAAAACGKRLDRKQEGQMMIESMVLTVPRSIGDAAGDDRHTSRPRHLSVQQDHFITTPIAELESAYLPDTKPSQLYTALGSSPFEQ
jgi:hypothetical protein